MEYAIKTLEIELAKIEETQRIEDRNSVYPEYKYSQIEWKKIMIELHKAITILIKYSDEFTEKKFQPGFPNWDGLKDGKITEDGNMVHGADEIHVKLIIENDSNTYIREIDNWQYMNIESCTRYMAKEILDEICKVKGVDSNGRKISRP